MNRILTGVCGFYAFASQSAFATVTVVNNDSVDYEFEVQCKNDAEPVNEWIDPRGIVDLEGGLVLLYSKQDKKLLRPIMKPLVLVRARLNCNKLVSAKLLRFSARI